ncbi:MAG: endo alpha-1,4 polygalactosaminidase, partial [Actinomycetota bacterium]
MSRRGDRRPAALALLALAGCGSPSDDADLTDSLTAPSTRTVAPARNALPVDATWQWQLQGEVNTDYDVDVYDIDLFDSPPAVIDALHAADRTVICYFSAGSYEEWRPDADDFADGALGEYLEGYDTERWLDVRDASVRAVTRQRLDLAAERDCDGVEPDNVDGYSNDSGFDLTSDDQLDFNRFLASEAHDRGLLIALKNALDEVPALVDAFDFAVNEQCFEYDECDALR